ncbi:MAG TPA: amidohydrolase family protein [Candidatus Binatia bacterium]
MGIGALRGPLGGLALAVVAWIAGCGRSTPLVELPPGAPPPTVIRAVAIYDGNADRRTSVRDVLLENGRIARIAPPGTIPRRAGMLQIDGANRTLLPGLIDVHGHVGTGTAPPWVNDWPDAKRNMQAYLYCGITTVLDPADLASDAFSRRDAVARGEQLGPRIYAAGPMFTAPGGHPVPAVRTLTPWWLRWYVVPRISRQVANAAEARAAVDALAPMHPDVIKVTVDAVPLDAPILDADTLRAIVDEARARGIRTVAHIGTTADALEAADAGVAAWMHGVYKERIPDEAIPRFVAAHIPEVATITVFDSYADLYEQRRETTALERETVPPGILDSLLQRPAGYRPGPEYEAYLPLLAATRDARRDNVGRLHAAGVTILAGSDTQTGVFPGAALHRELAALVSAGLTPAEALRAATGDAARFVANSPDPDFGTIATGKRADLLLVEGDPTAEIANVSRIAAVLLGGAVLVRHPVAP